MPRITQNKIVSQGSIATRRNLCSRDEKPLQARQTACLLSAQGETMQRLHIWWHFELQNCHQQHSLPL